MVTDEGIRVEINNPSDWLAISDARKTNEAVDDLLHSIVKSLNKLSFAVSSSMREKVDAEFTRDE